jgi:hypothetical protein
MRNSRWDNKARLKNGKPAGFRFENSDFDVISLHSPSRLPWGYKNLSTRYYASLLKRPSIGLRLRDLREVPHDFLCLPAQPKNNYRELIYGLSKLGKETLLEHKMEVPGKSDVRAHQVFSDITAASYEIATHKHPITLARSTVKLDGIRPDLDPFDATTPYHRKTVLVENDLSSESYIGEGTTIDKKFVHYLALMASGKLRRAFVAFYCVTPTRVDGMIDRLERTIDQHDHDHKLAENFGFRWISFDRFLNTIPAPSDWAVTGDYHRAGSLSPFNFLKP